MNIHSKLAHPYGIPGIGWASDIAQITPPQLMQFYATYYTPSNMTVAVVGEEATTPTGAAILATLAEPTDGRLLMHLLQSPIQDGGQWDMFCALIGAVMKDLRGQADAARVRELIVERLG